MNEARTLRRKPTPLDPDYRAAMLERLRRIVLGAVEGEPVDVYLFGSFARGDEKHYSDIDLALEGDGRIPPSLLADLRDTLEKSTIPRRVEIVDLADCGERMRERVRLEGIKWSA